MDQSTWPAGDDHSGSPPSPVAAAPARPPRPVSRRLAIVIAVLVAAGAVAYGLVASLGGPSGSTENVRVIIPPPLVVGGLREDLALQNQAAFQHQVAVLRHQYAKTVHMSSSAIAAYTGQPPGAAGRAGSAFVLYAGFNLPEHRNTAGDIKSALAGAAGTLTDVVSIRLPDGPGDTAYECETGAIPQTLLSVCGWATDRTLGLLIYYGSDPHATKLIALMRKMRPQLIRT